MFTVHSAALGWQGLSGTTLVPVRMTESEQVRGENWTICLQHSADTPTERALQTFTPLTASVPHLSKLQRSERTQWNCNHKHNPTRTHWAVSEMATLIKLTGGWPSKCQRQKSKTGTAAVKQNIARKNLWEIIWPIYSLKSTVNGVCMWAVHKRFDGLLSTACKNPPGVWSLGMNDQSHHAQVSAVSYL